MGQIIEFSELACEGITDPPYAITRVNGLIDLAEQTVESVTGRLFRKVDNHTMYVSGYSKELLNLEHPAISITSIEENGRALDSGDYEIVTDLIVEHALFKPQLRRIGGVWSTGNRNIKIVGSFGHVIAKPGSSPVVYLPPALIRRLIIRIVAFALKTPVEEVATAGRGDIVRERLGPAEFEYAQTAITSHGWTGDSEIAQTLARYRRLRMAAV